MSIIAKLREKSILDYRFSHEISDDFKKPTKKLMVQMLYGIETSKDVELSNITRSLNEEIPLIKTENRLSRNLARMDFTERINRNLIFEGGLRIKEETVIALDLSDLDKRYAQEMEYLALVRDGSIGETKSYIWNKIDVRSRPYEGNWYRCTSYSGPWAYIDRESVPDVFFHLPSDYRAMSEYRRIPYGELSGNWRAWQRERYWDRVGWGRDREREHGVAPFYGYEGREREHGVAPEFRGGEEQNLGRSNQGERQNQTGRQNMNRGGYGREER